MKQNRHEHWQEYVAPREEFLKTNVIYAFVCDKTKPQSSMVFFEWFLSKIPATLFYEYVSYMIGAPTKSFIIKYDKVNIIDNCERPIKSLIDSSQTTYRYLFTVESLN